MDISNNDRRRQLGMVRLLAMHNAQQIELNNINEDVIVYDHNDYSIKILEDRLGWLKVSVRNRITHQLEHIFKFEKQHHRGVIWTFYDACRLQTLIISSSVFNKIKIIEESK